MGKKLDRGNIFIEKSMEDIKIKKSIEKHFRQKEKRRRRNRMFNACIAPIKRLFLPVVRYFFYQYTPDRRNVWYIPMGPGGGWNPWTKRTQWGRIAIWTVLVILTCLVLKQYI